MASVTFTVPDDVKESMKELSWINWSDLARTETLKKLENETKISRLKQILSKSKLTKKDAFEIADKISKSMHESLKKEGLV